GRQEQNNKNLSSLTLKQQQTWRQALPNFPEPAFERERFRDMEGASRRLAVFSSHLRPVAVADLHCERFSGVSASTCSSSASIDEDENQTRVSDQEDANLEERCVFCRIIRGESPAYKIYEDEKCMCILDRNPLSRGHSLLIPKIHCCSLVATPPSVISAMCCKIPFISKAIMKATGCDSFNLLVNNGLAAGQVIFHTHIHIIPRQARDCLWASESLKRLTLNLDEESSQLANSIRSHISSLTNKDDDQRPT
ncbi:hypothetical protein V2J09_022000, partial [Rumex salicifolius]